MRYVWLLIVSVAVWCAPPRLVVVVCYDQLRADRLEVYAPLLRSGGFARVMKEGVLARHCQYDYATTVTAAGHATIATGCYPARHGIVDNEFVIGGRPLSAVDDTVLGVPSPRLLLVPTLGDVVRQKYPQSKVWSLSHKERSAIFLGGHHPNGALWLQAPRGLGSSSYYPPLPAWVEEFNRRHPLSRYAGMVWNATPSLPAPPDTVEWEGRFPQGTSYFPHRIIDDTADAAFGVSFALTPASVEWLFDAAIECIRAEGLGVDSIPDVLWISVSTTDLVGHLFGHDSREYAELLAACDRILARFIDTLDSRVGRANYVLVVTSDHGAASIPELERAQGRDAGRIDVTEFVGSIERWWQQRHSSSDGMVARKLVQHFFPPWLWLNLSAAASQGLDTASLVADLAAWLRQQKGIGAVVTTGELQRAGEKDSVQLLVERSYHPERCGQIAVYPKRYWIFGSTPAQHGTPYDYDRAVPLMMMGWELPAAVIEQLCSPADIAPTLACMLGVMLPGADGNILFPAFCDPR